MSEKIVYQGQSFLDKVLEITGSIENAFQMSLLNNIPITDDVRIGQELQKSEITQKYVVSIFNENNRPATGITYQQQQEIDNKGIGYMRIRSTFIVG